MVGPVIVFEEAMKHSKMKTGWAASVELGNQRAEWVKDAGLVCSSVCECKCGCDCVCARACHSGVRYFNRSVCVYTGIPHS